MTQQFRQSLSSSNIPVPDPSALTTEQLRRELLALRELLEARISAITDTLSTRRELFDSKIALVGEQLKERDLAREQIQKATSIALDKVEQSASKQIDALQKVLGAAVDGLNSKIGDIKERLDRGEGQGRGGEFYKAEKRQDITLIVAIIAGIAAVASTAITLLHSSPSQIPVMVESAK